MSYNENEKVFDIHLKLTNSEASALWRAVRRRYKDLCACNGAGTQKLERLCDMIGEQMDRILDKEG